MIYDVADKIRKLREQNGITQTELAQKLNITRSSVMHGKWAFPHHRHKI